MRLDPIKAAISQSSDRLAIAIAKSYKHESSRDLLALLTLENRQLRDELQKLKAEAPELQEALTEHEWQDLLAHYQQTRQHAVNAIFSEPNYRHFKLTFSEYIQLCSRINLFSPFDVFLPENAQELNAINKLIQHFAIAWPANANEVLSMDEPAQANILPTLEELLSHGLSFESNDAAITCLLTHAMAITIAEEDLDKLLTVLEAQITPYCSPHTLTKITAYHHALRGLATRNKLLRTAVETRLTAVEDQITAARLTQEFSDTVTCLPQIILERVSSTPRSRVLHADWMSTILRDEFNESVRPSLKEHVLDRYKHNLTAGHWHYILQNYKAALELLLEKLLADHQDKVSLAGFQAVANFLQNQLEIADFSAFFLNDGNKAVVENDDISIIWPASFATYDFAKETPADCFTLLNCLLADAANLTKNAAVLRACLQHCLTLDEANIPDYAWQKLAITEPLDPLHVPYSEQVREVYSEVRDAISSKIRHKAISPGSAEEIIIRQLPYIDYWLKGNNYFNDLFERADFKNLIRRFPRYWQRYACASIGTAIKLDMSMTDARASLALLSKLLLPANLMKNQLAAQVLAKTLADALHYPSLHRLLNIELLSLPASQGSGLLAKLWAAAPEYVIEYCTVDVTFRQNIITMLTQQDEPFTLPQLKAMLQQNGVLAAAIHMQLTHKVDPPLIDTIAEQLSGLDDDELGECCQELLADLHAGCARYLFFSSDKQKRTAEFIENNPSLRLLALQHCNDKQLATDILGRDDYRLHDLLGILRNAHELSADSLDCICDKVAAIVSDDYNTDTVFREVNINGYSLMQATNGDDSDEAYVSSSSAHEQYYDLFRSYRGRTDAPNFQRLLKAAFVCFVNLGVDCLSTQDFVDFWLLATRETQQELCKKYFDFIDCHLTARSESLKVRRLLFSSIDSVYHHKVTHLFRRRLSASALVEYLKIGVSSPEFITSLCANYQMTLAELPFTVKSGSDDICLRSVLVACAPYQKIVDQLVAISVSTLKSLSDDEAIELLLQVPCLKLYQLYQKLFHQREFLQKVLIPKAVAARDILDNIADMPADRLVRLEVSAEDLPVEPYYPQSIANVALLLSFICEDKIIVNTLNAVIPTEYLLAYLLRGNLNPAAAARYLREYILPDVARKIHTRNVHRGKLTGALIPGADIKELEKTIANIEGRLSRLFSQIIKTFPYCREVINLVFAQAKHLEFIPLEDIFFILEQPLMSADSAFISLNDKYRLITIDGLYAYHPLVKWQSGLARLPNFHFKMTVCRKAMKFTLYGTEIHKLSHPGQISAFFNSMLSKVEHAAFVMALYSLHLDELMSLVRKQYAQQIFPDGMTNPLDYRSFIAALTASPLESQVMRQGLSTLFFNCLKYLTADDVNVVLQQDSIHLQLRCFFIKHYVSRKDFFDNGYILKLIHDLTGKTDNVVFQALINCVRDPSDLLQRLHNREATPWLRDLQEKKYQQLVLRVAVNLMVAYQAGTCLRGYDFVAERLLTAWAQGELPSSYAKLFVSSAPLSHAQFMYYLAQAKKTDVDLLALFCPQLSESKIIDLLADSSTPIDDTAAKFFAQKLLPTLSQQDFEALSDRIRQARLTPGEREQALQRLWRGVAVLQDKDAFIVIRLTASEYRRFLQVVNYARGEEMISSDCHFALAIGESWYIRGEFYQKMMHLRSGLNSEMATLRRARSGCLFFDGSSMVQVEASKTKPVELDREALQLHWRAYGQS